MTLTFPSVTRFFDGILGELLTLSRWRGRRLLEGFTPIDGFSVFMPSVFMVCFSCLWRWQCYCCVFCEKWPSAQSEPKHNGFLWRVCHKATANANGQNSNNLIMAQKQPLSKNIRDTARHVVSFRRLCFLASPWWWADTMPFWPTKPRKQPSWGSRTVVKCFFQRESSTQSVTSG